MEARRTKTLVLATLCGTMFMAMIDNVIVNNALPRIGQHLHAGVGGLQWVVEGYSLVYAALLLTGGTLGDRYGRRRIFLTGLVLFTAGSAAAALSGSIGLLIAARMVQGLGAAMLTPGTLSILRNVFTDEKERARAIGVWSGVSALGLAVGPVVGGPMVEAFGWGSVFWINVPVGVAALVLGLRVLPELATRPRSLDLPGQVLAALGLAGLVYALIEGPARGWTDPVVLGSGVAALATLAAFVVVERRTADPMLDLRFFRDRVLTGAVLSGFMVSFGMFGASFFLPLLLQGVMGWTPSDAGLAGLPMTAMIVIAAPLSGALGARLGPRLPVVAGLALCATALAGLSLYDEHARYPEYIWVLFVMGFGMGLTFAPVSIAVMGRVAPTEAGMASATVNTLRELGGVVGIAVLGAVLTSRLSSALAGPLTRLGVPDGARRRIADAVTGPGAGGVELPGPVHAAVNVAFVDGLHLALRVGAVALAGTAALVAVLLRPSPVPGPTGQPDAELASV
ncbi:MFS transporter [Longispora fulva]|uniref:EmrB/QacA subfamily drug resistance transporter n=1 Tax=Longispora fulva TaxID=619741 RepID=A0A8J7GFW7_9ACTN|nr:MFS transporter [Longispora fulva]MBG6137066.1 EmrB/QacA subfamily drug resistance transporter [Longispora fulva]GIG61580.1 MFS transporter [Longispora fulva]